MVRKTLVLDLMGLACLMVASFSNNFSVQIMAFGIALYAFISSHQLALQGTLKELLKKEVKI